MNNRISSFPPIISKNSKILILGSVPGVKSLERNEYYAHPQNKFWKIVFKLLNENPTNNYAEKINILNQHGIGLWDVIDSCERKGSLDSEIKNDNANDINGFLKEYSEIRAVFCNGQKSYKNLRKILNKDTSIPVFVMPSTSPAHASLSFDEKFLSWSKILEFMK